MEFLLNLIKFCNLIITPLSSHTLTDHFSENDLEPGDGYGYVMIKIILSFIIHLKFVEHLFIQVFIGIHLLRCIHKHLIG